MPPGVCRCDASQGYVMTVEQAGEEHGLSELTGAELWQRAQEYRTMAETATDRDQRETYRRLAWQYEKRAMEKRATR